MTNSRQITAWWYLSYVTLCICTGVLCGV